MFVIGEKWINIFMCGASSSRLDRFINASEKHGKIKTDVSQPRTVTQRISFISFSGHCTLGGSSLAMSSTQAWQHVCDESFLRNRANWHELRSKKCDEARLTEITETTLTLDSHHREVRWRSMCVHTSDLTETELRDWREGERIVGKRLEETTESARLLSPSDLPRLACTCLCCNKAHLQFE